MKQIKHSNAGQDFLLIPVPPIANRFHLFNDLEPYLSYFLKSDTERFYLPTGFTYEIVGLASEVSEEVALTLVQSQHMVSPHPCECCGYDYMAYRDYADEANTWDDYPGVDCLSTATESLQSLALSHGIEPNKCLILKQS